MEKINNVLKRIINARVHSKRRRRAEKIINARRSQKVEGARIHVMERNGNSQALFLKQFFSKTKETVKLALAGLNYVPADV